LEGVNLLAALDSWGSKAQKLTHLANLGWKAMALLPYMWLLCLHATTLASRTAARWRAAQEMPEVDHPLMAGSGITPATIKFPSPST